LKKRTEKFLPMRSSTAAQKFLLLFFKKKRFAFC